MKNHHFPMVFLCFSYDQIMIFRATHVAVNLGFRASQRCPEGHPVPWLLGGVAAFMSQPSRAGEARRLQGGNRCFVAQNLENFMKFWRFVWFFMEFGAFEKPKSGFFLGKILKSPE